MSNGLDDLAGRRRRRQPPPPKHPRSEQQSAPEAAPDPQPEPEPEPTQAPRASKPTRDREPEKSDRPRRSDATRATRTPSVEAYLDQELLDWLWQIEAAAVARRERAVVSPAIRLALRELKERMSPEQVVDLLFQQTPQERPRR